MFVGKFRGYVLIMLAVLAFGFTGANKAAAADAHLVDYRAPNWVTSHFHDSKKAEALKATVKKLGCEVKMDSHGNHIDLSFRCPKWRRISLTDHDKAHQWENWLKANRFETRHAH